MSVPDRVNRPYNDDFEPALYVGATVALQPAEEVYYVNTLEVLPTVVTQEFTVPAESELDEQEIRSLYGQSGVLVQVRLPDPPGDEGAIPEGIEIRVNQGGEESPRFNIKNSRGFLDSDTPFYGDAAQQTELFQYEDEDLFFDIENTTDEEITFELKYTGWAYDLRTDSDTHPTEADVAVLTERKSLRGL